MRLHISTWCTEISHSEKSSVTTVTANMSAPVISGSKALVASLAWQALRRSFSTNAPRLQKSAEIARPPVPGDAKQQAYFAKSNLHQELRNYELERTRVIPKLNTFYGGNPVHDDKINQLNALIEKYQDLPTRTFDAREVKSFKFVSFEEYQHITQSGTRLKVGHHKALITALNRLKSIEPELMPREVSEALDTYSSGGEERSKSTEKSIKQLDEFGRANAVGKRKRSVANISMVRGSGEVLVNGESFAKYFPRDIDREKIAYPFKVVSQEGQYNIFIEVKSGGLSGQAEAAMYGIAKALVIFNPLLKPRLRLAGLITRDARKVERKKPGKVKARKSPTWVKR